MRVVRLTDRSDVQVTEIPARARSPVWSPDGKLLAFLILPGKDSLSQEVWITPVSETGKAAATPTKIRLSGPTYDSLAGWSTGNKIGLLFPSPQNAAIYTVPTSGGKATQVTPAGAPFHPRWSPDGQRVYLRWDFGDIAFVPAGGGKITVVPQTGAKVIEAVPGGSNHISHDGKQIVFSGYMEGLSGVHVWTMPVTGGKPVRLTTKPDDEARCPRWSPDGKRVAYISVERIGEGKFEGNIHVLPANGGEPRKITAHTGCLC